MKLYVGTSGYAYKEWKGTFYPPRLAEKNMLEFYASQLNTVEINNTFYRFPKTEVLNHWREQVNKDFRFVIKANQRITHIYGLRDVDQTTTDFVERVKVLGKQLGAVLFQLPGRIRKDLTMLEDFVEGLPNNVRYAFEFRHKSWFEDDVLERLRAKDCALCIADTDDAPADTAIKTARWGYLRLRRSNYTPKALEQWMQRIQDQSWRHAFVFFKHETETSSPALARQFLEMATSETAATHG